MPRSLAPALVTFLVASAFLAPSAVGSEAEPLWGVASGPSSESIRFESDGGTIALALQGSGSGAAGGGIYLGGPAGSILVTVARIPNHDGLLVEHQGAVSVRADMSAATNPDGSFSEQIVLYDAPAGTYDLIAFGAGGVTQWTWTVQDEGASLARKATGGTTWLATSRDFRGESNVQVFEAGAGARATDGRFAFGVEKGLVGVFYQVHATSVHESLMASTPAGPRECTCAWLANGPRGGYVLHESGVGAGHALLAEVVFIGADATFA